MVDSEHTVRCCLGNIFFKHRYQSDPYTPSQTAKKKPPLDGELKRRPEGDKVRPSTAATAVTSVYGANLTQKGPPLPGPEVYVPSSVASNSYTSAVRQQTFSWITNDDPPPRYTPMSKTEDTATVSEFRAPSVDSRTRRQPAVCYGPANCTRDELAVQNLWLESQVPSVQLAGKPLIAEVQQEMPTLVVESGRPSSFTGFRTILLYDRMTGTTYRRGRLLGKGGFARCYEMIDTKTNMIYAGKVISKARLSKPRQREKIMFEVELHRSLHHANIVEFHSFFEDDHNIYFILENCSRKSLVQLLKTRQTLTEPEVRYYMSQLVNGVRFIHYNRVVHRDLKLGNMLLNENMQVKIADFGLAARIEYRGKKKKVPTATLR